MKLFAPYNILFNNIFINEGDISYLNGELNLMYLFFIPGSPPPYILYHNKKYLGVGLRLLRGWWPLLIFFFDRFYSKIYTKKNIRQNFNYFKKVNLSKRTFSSSTPPKLTAENMAWLVGLIEGDGWFSITKNGKYCKYEFGLELHIRDIQLLYKIKKLLGVGKIDIRKDRNTAIFRLRKKSQLKDIILPIFDQFPMLTAKYWDYVNFKNNLLANVILYSDYKLYVRPDLPALNDLSNTNLLNLTGLPIYFDDWLVGFIEAEGCFTNYKPSNSESETASFEIRQTNGLPIMNSIKSRLSLKANVCVDKTNSAHLKTTSIEGINSIINFLHKTNAKLKGYKRLQYLIFLNKLRQNPRYKKLIIPNKYGND